MNNFLFIRIPRTASSSVCTALNLSDWHIPSIERKTELTDFDTRFKFTFVRHPFERFLSAFRGLSIFYGWENPNVWLAENKLEEFAPEPGFNFTIMRPQTDYLLDENGKILVDFIGRHETLQDDWKTVCKRIEFPYKPLPILTRISEKPKIELNDDSKKILREYYVRDFEILNY